MGVFVSRSEKQHLKIPLDIDDAKMLAKLLDQYKDMYYFEVMFGVVLLYILYPFQIKASLATRNLCNESKSPRGPKSIRSTFRCLCTQTWNELASRYFD